jgi:hypothetical protein
MKGSGNTMTHVVQCNGPRCERLAAVPTALSIWIQRTAGVEGTSVRSSLDFCSFDCERAWHLEVLDRETDAVVRAAAEQMQGKVDAMRHDPDFLEATDPADWWPIYHQGCGRPGAYYQRMPDFPDIPEIDDFVHIDGSSFDGDDLLTQTYCGTCGEEWPAVMFLARAQLALEAWQGHLEDVESQQANPGTEEDADAPR